MKKEFYKGFKNETIERLTNINEGYWEKQNKIEKGGLVYRKRIKFFTIEIVNKNDGEIFTIDLVRNIHYIKDFSKILIVRTIENEKLILDMDQFILLSVNS